MFNRILVPVDLAHIDRLNKAITAATDLAKFYRIPIIFAGVTADQPTAVAHTPTEYVDKLRDFGKAQSEAHGLDIDTAAYASHDPAVDLATTLIEAAQDTGADLIIMASHVPGFADHIFTSNAGAVAVHATVSVFVVR